MKYERIREGVFIERPNRFISYVEIEGNTEICHVKNTGRCKELLIPGARVHVNEAVGEKRKTKFDLISVYKGDRLINIDSQAPNQVFFEWVKAGNFLDNVNLIRREYTFGSSRFDFYLETKHEKILVEVKGVTLEENGRVLFPDAPTMRGVRHLKELIESKEKGYHPYGVFVVQMKNVLGFSPNQKTHPEFAKAFWEAKKQGVTLLALDCHVTKDEMKIADFVPIFGE